MLRMGLISFFYLDMTSGSMTCLCGYREKLQQNESDQWPIKILSHSIWIKFSYITRHLGTWFSGGLGSVRLMVGLDDLKGVFQPK